MSRVDFAFGAADRLRMACDVVHKQYLSGRPIAIYGRDKSLLKRFDHMLWGFEATVFIPHVWADDPLADVTPVLFTTGQAPVKPASSTEKAAWLLNLDAECPPEAARFERILEIVSQDPEEVQHARQRWREYKAAGHDLHAHDVSRRTQ